MDINKEIGRLADWILIQEDRNERKTYLDNQEHYYRCVRDEIHSYLKEVKETKVFYSDLNALLIKNNKVYLENEIDKKLENFFPHDSFKSEIDVEIDKKGNYLASLLMGKRGKKPKDLEFQNGDFVQQLTLFGVYNSLLKGNGGKLFFIDEGFSNVDINREEGVANMLDELDIPFILMIEHRPNIIANLKEKNIIKLYRDPLTNIAEEVK